MSDHLSNWDAIWQDFHWDDLAESDDVLRQRLKERARHYAEPVQQVDLAGQDSRMVLGFELGSEYYGVDVMSVQGVRTVNRITRVPGTPPFYLGVINVRGSIITALDMRLFFNMPLREESGEPRELVIVASEHLTIGLVAHNVVGVQTIPLAEVEPVDNMRYAWGVMQSQMVLLDIERLLQDDQLIVGRPDEN
jgi:purine-binding chemotaxis protein CheW